MKRETVKELLTLSDKTLKDAKLSGLVKHREVAQHYANGGDVEVYYGEYELISTPYFRLRHSYRKAIPEIEVFGVKVRANPPETESFDKCEVYYYLTLSNSDMYAYQHWYGDKIDYALLKNKAIWKRESDIKAVVKALRGEK